MTHFAAVSRRPSVAPVLHALPTNFVKKHGQTTVRAECGAQVATPVGFWDAAHGRACPRCREVVAS